MTHRLALKVITELSLLYRQERFTGKCGTTRKFKRNGVFSISPLVKILMLFTLHGGFKISIIFLLLKTIFSPIENKFYIFSRCRAIKSSI